MPLNIKDENAHAAARELARLRGISMTEAVADAIQEALDRERSTNRSHTHKQAAALDEIALHCAGLPVVDNRTPGEILGYNRMGIPE